MLPRLKCIERLRTKAAALGCSLDDDYDIGIIIDAPPGKAFQSTLSTTIIEPAVAFGGGSSWWAEACRDAEKSLSAGLEPFDPHVHGDE